MRPNISTTQLSVAAPILSGVLIGLSFPPFDLSWLAWIALVPLAWSWSRTSAPRSAFWAAFAGGVIAHLMSLSWVRTSYADGVDAFGPFTDVWIGMSLLGGVLFCVFFGLGAWLTRKRELPMALFLPVACVAFELLRASFTIPIDKTGFPFCKLGMTQAGGEHLVQVADLGGVYLLSFLVAMVNGAIFDAARVLSSNRSRSSIAEWAGPIAAVSLLTCAATYGNWRFGQQATERGPVVCLMPDVDLPPYLSRDRIASAPVARDATLPAPYDPERPSDILLWPELAYHHQLLDVADCVRLTSRDDIPIDVRMTAGASLDTYPQYVREGLANSAAEIDATLILGCDRLECDGRCWKRFNTILNIDPRGGVVYYDKCHPIPWKEFNPLAGDDVDPNSEAPYRQGGATRVFSVRSRASKKDYQYAITCCFDLCFANHFRRARVTANGQNGVDFVVHCGAEAFEHTGVLQNVMLREARIRAIESRRAFVRNVTGSCSGVIDGNGVVRVAAAEATLTAPCQIGAVPIDRRASVYAACGDWPLMLLCGAVILSTLGRRPISTRLHQRTK